MKLSGLTLLILGAKFRVLRMCSSSLPIFDQWEAEGQRLLLPWLRGQLRPGDLFAPWVQHRIVWTRLLVLGLFQLNGQWDTQVQAIVAAVIHAATAVLLGVILIRRLGRAHEDLILLCLLTLFGLPFALENTLSGGFASQYYTLLLFTVVTIWGLASHPPGTAGWWLGAAGAVLAWFSVAAGALPSLAVAAWMGVKLTRRDGPTRENTITLVVALALGVGGLSLSLGTEHLDTLQPRSVGELLGRFAGLLGWPNPTAWTAPIAYAPLMCLVWRMVRGRRPTGRTEAFLCPLAFFVLLNTAAIAYARNRYGGLEVSRYMDFLSLGALVNFACLLVLWRQIGWGSPASRPVRAGTAVMALVWISCTGFGLMELTTHNLLVDLPFFRAVSERGVESVAAFVARPDPQHALRKDPYVFMCAKPELVETLLQDPLIRPILAWQGRLPIALQAASASPHVLAATAAADDSTDEGWRLIPAHDGQPVRFRSQTLRRLRLPYLLFPEVSGLDGNTFMSLVDEHSGETIPLEVDPLQNGSQPVMVRRPTGPFHVEAVIAAGSSRRLEFANPRDVGWLSAWADTFLNGSADFLWAGSTVWLLGFLLAFPRSTINTASQR